MVENTNVVDDDTIVLIIGSIAGITNIRCAMIAARILYFSEVDLVLCIAVTNDKAALTPFTSAERVAVHL